MKYKLYKARYTTDVYLLYINSKRTGSFTRNLSKIRTRVVSWNMTGSENVPPNIELFFEFNTLEEFDNKFVEYLI